MCWLEKWVLVISRCHGHEISVLNRELILLLGDCHHKKVSGNTHLRLGRHRWSNDVTQVCRLVKVSLVFFADNGLVRHSRGHLSTNRHTTSLATQIFGGDGSHLLSFNRVTVSNYSLAHLIFRTLDRIWCLLVWQERPNDLLNLFEMVGSNFLDQLLMFCMCLDRPQRLLWQLSNVAWHKHWVLALLFRVHYRVEHSVWLRRFHETIIVRDCGKIWWAITSLNIQRFHLFRPIRTAEIIWIRLCILITSILLIMQGLSRAMLRCSLSKVLMKVFLVYLIEVRGLVWTTRACSVDILLTSLNQVLIATLQFIMYVSSYWRHVFVAMVVGVRSRLNTTVWQVFKPRRVVRMLSTLYKLGTLSLRHKNSVNSLRNGSGSGSWISISNSHDSWIVDLIFFCLKVRV